jgi:chromatin assembly factor 1 subunit B
MPLPAVMPSASPSLSGGLGLGLRNTNIYANETFTSFFRRLTFAPDGSLLFTPAGQYKTSNAPGVDGSKTTDDIINTVYIYTRAGLNKPPVAYLPGHKKPSIAVKCSPVYYHLRVTCTDTKEITIDTRTDEDIPPLPEPAITPKPPTSNSAMDPPPLSSAPSPAQSAATMASPRQPMDAESPSATAPPAGPPPAFGLPYRIVYAVATQDAVHVYDTQQQKPLCVVSNLHYATFTDLTWSSDGQTLLMTSSDGFCSALTFSPGELGTVYHPPANAKHTPTPISVARANSASSTPQPTPNPTSATGAAPPVPPMPRQHSHSNPTPPTNPSPSPYTPAARPASPARSPARSMSVSSIGTEASFARAPDQNAPPVMNNPTPSMSAMPPIAATGMFSTMTDLIICRLTNRSGSNSNPGGIPLFTPPQTPGHHVNGSTNSVPGMVAPSVKHESNASETGNVAAGVKREIQASESAEESGREKRRRIAPTLVTDGDGTASARPPPPQPAASESDG